MLGGFQSTSAQIASIDFKAGEKFTVSELNLGDKAYVIDYKEIDVTGDQVKDNILLVGHKEFSPKDIFADSLTIVVQDGKTKKYSKATDENFCGYEGKLFIGDFSGDQVKDVMVSAATGGSGGIVNHLIATFKNHTPALLFSEKDNMGIESEGKFVDGFKAELTSKNFNQKIIIDLNVNKDNYIQQGIYDSSEKLLKAVEPFNYPFSLLEPIDYNRDGIYELKGSQRIVGTCNADTISFVNSILKFENNKWTITQSQYSTFLVK